MKVILDELKRNDVDIDMRTLTHHVNYVLKHHETLYNQLVPRIDPDKLSFVFIQMNVNNFGRAIAYLTLVYVMNDSCSEHVTRRAVQLVAAPLRSFDFTKFKIEESSFRKMISFAQRIFSL